MSPLAAILVILGLAVFGLLALLGERQFAGRERIQLRLASGEHPGIFAPRWFILAIFPFLGLAVLLGLAFGGAPVFILSCALLAMAACNLIYFRAIGRILQEQ